MIRTHESQSNTKFTVFVIMSSIRHGRRCPEIASWVIGIAQDSTSLKYELVDLADWPLPMNDEPDMPAQGIYTQEHTRAWSAKIASADAIIFVTPEYNRGYPAPLKNAIDHLYKEWNGKPAVIVTYGGHGGGKCADQLKQVVEGVKMRPVVTTPGIVLTYEMIQGAPINQETDFLAYSESIRQALAELVVQLESPIA